MDLIGRETIAMTMTLSINIVVSGYVTKYKVCYQVNSQRYARLPMLNRYAQKKLVRVLYDYDESDEWTQKSQNLSGEALPVPSPVLVSPLGGSG